jgi:hypothetical protein
MVYEWHIHKLVCTTSAEQPNTVIEASWSLFGLLDGKPPVSSTEFGVETLPPYDPANPFIPYDQLTETQVIDWVKTSMGNAKIQELEAKIEQRTKAKPVLSPQLPWNT